MDLIVSIIKFSYLFCCISKVLMVKKKKKKKKKKKGIVEILSNTCQSCDII